MLFFSVEWFMYLMTVMWKAYSIIGSSSRTSKELKRLFSPFFYSRQDKKITIIVCILASYTGTMETQFVYKTWVSWLERDFRLELPKCKIEKVNLLEGIIGICLSILWTAFLSLNWRHVQESVNNLFDHHAMETKVRVIINIYEDDQKPPPNVEFV